MKQATYKCDSCKSNIILIVKDKFPIFTECEKCQKPAFRLFKDTEITKEPENVSAAIQTMLYSKLPSGRDKAVS